MAGYLIIILIAYLFVLLFGYWLEYLNLSHLKRYGSHIPPEFEGQIDKALLGRIRAYTVEKTRFGIFTSIINNILVLLFLFAGPMNLYNSWIVSLNLPFILSGLIFFLILFYILTTLTIPFSLYNSFRIEKRYGFSTVTLRLWVTDLIKSVSISTVLMALLISMGLWLIQWSPNLWWLWIWSFFLVFGIFIMYVSPYVIEPLFYKFTPIENEMLEDGIRNIMQKAGIRVSRVFKMNASKRTKHTNAYFTGIGRVKRIVLFDTLIEKMENVEILSVLAHEAGHWKKRHLLKRLIITEGIALIAIFISFRVLQSDFLINLFNVEEGTFFTKVLILGFLGSIVGFPLTPLLNYLSRRHENDADRFSYELTGDGAGMISALVKLSKDNLANLHPHPLYAAFNYSHPPIVERIGRIKEMAKGTG
jgi:STE24 endopeptidase